MGDSDGRRRVCLAFEVEYDPGATSADAVASAVDRLLDTALSTTGVLDECGPVDRVGDVAVCVSGVDFSPAAIRQHFDGHGGLELEAWLGSQDDESLLQIGQAAAIEFGSDQVWGAFGEALGICVDEAMGQDTTWQRPTPGAEGDRGGGGVAGR